MENNMTPSSSALPRRDFLKKTVTAAAVVAAAPLLRTPVYGQNQAPSANVAGANNRIAVGVVGVGFGIGQNHLVGIHEKANENNTVVAAASDVFNKRRDFAKVKAGLKDADVYENYQDLIKRKDIDAVVVATHDPLHAQITLDSLDAGKHVYCEKPLSRYLGEAFQVYDKVKASKKVFQIGSQGCSAGGYQKCAELVKAGKIGPLVWAQAWYSRNSINGEWNYLVENESTAANINWERWLGPVKTRDPFSAQQFHRWRKYYRYCAGPLGDLAPHRLHPVMLATGNPEFPSRVAAIGTRKVLTDKNTPGTPLRDSPEILQLIAEFPSGLTMHICSSTVNEQGVLEMIRGQKGSLYMGGNKVELKPEKPFSEDFDPESFGPFADETFEAHHKNFFESIRANKQPNCNVDLATRVQTVVCLGEMANRMSTMVLFDEKTRKCTDASGKELTPFDYGIGEEPAKA